MSVVLCNLVCLYLLTARKPAQRFCIFFFGLFRGGGGWVVLGLRPLRPAFWSSSLLRSLMSCYTCSLLRGGGEMGGWGGVINVLGLRPSQPAFWSSSLFCFHTSCYVGYVFSTSLHILSCYVGYVFSTSFKHHVRLGTSSPLRCTYLHVSLDTSSLLLSHTFMFRWIRLPYFVAHTFMLRGIRLLYFVFTHHVMLDTSSLLRCTYFHVMLDTSSRLFLHILSCYVGYVFST